MENKQNIKPVNSKGIRIEVTGNGVLTANVRVQYFIVRIGLKFQQKADNSKKKGIAKDEQEVLKY